MQSMKSKTHSHSGNGNATNSGGSSSHSPPQSSHREFIISHYRCRLRSKAFSEIKKLGSFAADIIGRRNLRYFFLLLMLYFSSLLMYGCPFLALIGRAPIPMSVYRGHEILQKLWLDIEADNSIAIEADREARARRNGNYMIFDDDHADREARATD